MPATGSISFNQIPSNIRNPLFYAEVSNTAAGYFKNNGRALIIGQSVNQITETPVLVPSVDYAKQTWGTGSQIAIMVEAFRKNNSYTEVWALPLNDVNGATAAASTITFTGPATASGTIFLYVGNTLIQAPVATGNDATTIASSVVTVVNNIKDLPVTASSALGVVTLTAKNKGTVGNTLPVSLNFRGTLNGEALPAGVGATVSAMTGGATDPSVDATKLANIGDMDVAFYVHPYGASSSPATILDAFKVFLASRWNALVGKDGHAFTAVSNTLSALQTLGLSRNDENHTIIGYEAGSINPTWAPLVAAAYTGQASYSLLIDPARTLQTLELVGVSVPAEPSRFTLSNRSTLLNSGISTLMYKSGAAQIERAITTYQLNSYGQNDPSYLDVTTRTTLSYIKKSVGYLITQKYPRQKLAADGTVFGAGQAIVTPKDIRATLIAWYDELNFIGICQNPKGFEDNLLVTLNPTDPNRVDILLPPTLVNNLIVAAVKVEFRLAA